MFQKKRAASVTPSVHSRFTPAAVRSFMVTYVDDITAFCAKVTPISDICKS